MVVVEGGGGGGLSRLGVCGDSGHVGCHGRGPGDGYGANLGTFCILGTFCGSR